MAIDLPKKSVSMMKEQYMISNVRRIKLTRELSEGKQRRLVEWVF